MHVASQQTQPSYVRTHLDLREGHDMGPHLDMQRRGATALPDASAMAAVLA